MYSYFVFVWISSSSVLVFVFCSPGRFSSLPVCEIRMLIPGRKDLGEKTSEKRLHFTLKVVRFGMLPSLAMAVQSADSRQLWLGGMVCVCVPFCFLTAGNLFSCDVPFFITRRRSEWVSECTLGDDSVYQLKGHRFDRAGLTAPVANLVANLVHRLGWKVPFNQPAKFLIGSYAGESMVFSMVLGRTKGEFLRRLELCFWDLCISVCWQVLWW